MKMCLIQKVTSQSCFQCFTLFFLCSTAMSSAVSLAPLPHPLFFNANKANITNTFGQGLQFHGKRDSRGNQLHRWLAATTTTTTKSLK